MAFSTRNNLDLILTPIALILIVVFILILSSIDPDPGDKDTVPAGAVNAGATSTSEAIDSRDPICEIDNVFAAVRESTEQEVSIVEAALFPGYELGETVVAEVTNVLDYAPTQGYPYRWFGATIIENGRETDAVGIWLIENAPHDPKINRDMNRTAGLVSNALGTVYRRATDRSRSALSALAKYLEHGCSPTSNSDTVSTPATPALTHVSSDARSRKTVETRSGDIVYHDGIFAYDGGNEADYYCRPQYRTATNANAFLEPSKDSEVVRTFRQGVVIAWDDQIESLKVITKEGVVRASRALDIQAYDTSIEDVVTLTMNPNDSLLTLGYVGEGDSYFERNGRVYQGYVPSDPSIEVAPGLEVESFPVVEKWIRLKSVVDDPPSWLRVDSEEVYEIECMEMSTDGTETPKEQPRESDHTDTLRGVPLKVIALLQDYGASCTPIVGWSALELVGYCGDPDDAIRANKEMWIYQSPQITASAVLDSDEVTGTIINIFFDNKDEASAFAAVISSELNAISHRTEKIEKTGYGGYRFYTSSHTWECMVALMPGSLTTSGADVFQVSILQK